MTSDLPNKCHYFMDHNYLCERAILAPRNSNVNSSNFEIQKLQPGNVAAHKSHCQWIQMAMLMKHSNIGERICYLVTYKPQRLSHCVQSINTLFWCNLSCQMPISLIQQL